MGNKNVSANKFNSKKNGNHIAATILWLIFLPFLLVSFWIPEIAKILGFLVSIVVLFSWCVWLRIEQWSDGSLTHQKALNFSRRIYFLLLPIAIVLILLGDRFESFFPLSSSSLLPLIAYILYGFLIRTLLKVDHSKISAEEIVIQNNSWIGGYLSLVGISSILTFSFYLFRYLGA